VLPWPGNPGNGKKVQGTSILGPKSDSEENVITADAITTKISGKLDTAAVPVFPLGRILTAALFMALVLSQSARATDGTWIGNSAGTQNWSDTTKWSGGAVADGGGFANFSTLNITAARNVTIDTTSRTVRRIDIGDTNASHSYTIAASGGASLIFDNTANSANAQLNQVVNSNGDTISAPVLLNSSLDITNASSAALTISGVISNGSNGAAAITHNGTGPLTLTGANTYSGGTTLSSGTLRAGGSSTVSGGVVTSGPVGTGTLTLNGGTFSSDKAHSNGGDRTFENNLSLSGTVTMGDSTNTGALTFDSAGLTTPATINLSGNTSLTISNPTSQPVTFADAVTGAGSLTKLGGGVLALSGSNTYSGNTVLGASSGTLLLKNTNALQNSTLNYTGSTLTFDSSVASHAFTFGGLTGSANIALQDNAGTPNAVALSVGNNNSSPAAYSGILSGAGSLTKVGSGTTTLSGANTYTGNTTVNAGTLAVDNNNTTTARLANTSTVTANPGGTLLLFQSGATASTNRINDSALVNLAGGTFKLNGVSEGTGTSAGIGALSLTSNSIIDLASTSLLHFAASNSQTWSGTLSIYNWSGTPVTGGGAEELLFGTNSSGLTPAQLSQIQFYSDAGHTAYAPGATILSTGEVVPTAVPEPTIWVLDLVGLILIVYTQRRRFAWKQDSR
jgi:autotransporter-associated beta strand protein